MNRTLGAPSLARSGCGHAGCDTSNVLPITPENAVPSLYSFNAILLSSYEPCSFIFFRIRSFQFGARSLHVFGRKLSKTRSGLILDFGPISRGNVGAINFLRPAKRERFAASFEGCRS